MCIMNLRRTVDLRDLYVGQSVSRFHLASNLVTLSVSVRVTLLLRINSSQNTPPTTKINLGKRNVQKKSCWWGEWRRFCRRDPTRVRAEFGGRRTSPIEAGRWSSLALVGHRQRRRLSWNDSRSRLISGRNDWRLRRLLPRSLIVWTCLSRNAGGLGRTVDRSWTVLSWINWLSLFNSCLCRVGFST